MLHVQIAVICIKNSMAHTRTALFIDELKLEYKATRACLERIPENLFGYKPHPKSMNLGYLALLVAEIPLWIKHMVTDGEIDFVSFKHFSPATTEDLLNHFEANMEAAKSALRESTDEKLQEAFTLKANGKVLYTSPKVVD